MEKHENIRLCSNYLYFIELFDITEVCAKYLFKTSSQGKFFSV